MRKQQIADGSGVVEIRGRRATVRIAGTYVGTVTKHDGGRWTVPGSPAVYRCPADAAEALADDTLQQAA
jgi:hypothetical protein